MVTNICWKSANSWPSSSIPCPVRTPCCCDVCCSGSLGDTLGFFFSDSPLSGLLGAVDLLGITGLLGGMGGGTPLAAAPFFGGVCGAVDCCCKCVWKEGFGPALIVEESEGPVLPEPN